MITNIWRMLLVLGVVTPFSVSKASCPDAEEVVIGTLEIGKREDTSTGLTFVNEGVTAEQLNSLVAVSESFHRFFQGTVEFMKALSVYVYPKGGVDHFNPIQKRILVGYRYQYRGGYNKKTTGEAILLHEMAHGIFSMELAKSWSLYRQVLNAKETVAENQLYLRKKVQPERTELSRQIRRLKKAGDLAKAEALQKKYDELTEEVIRIRDQNKTLNAQIPDQDLFFKVSNYNELMADVMTVAFTHNPKSIYDALFIEGVSDAPGGWKLAGLKKPIQIPVRYRDFTERFPTEGWVETQEHSMFAPVRGHIWHEYLKAESNPVARRDIAVKILRVVHQEIQRTYNKKMSSRALNEDLIEAIDRAFRDGE